MKSFFCDVGCSIVFGYIANVKLSRELICVPEVVKSGPIQSARQFVSQFTVPHSVVLVSLEGPQCKIVLRAPEHTVPPLAPTVPYHIPNMS